MAFAGTYHNKNIEEKMFELAAAGSAFGIGMPIASGSLKSKCPL